MERSLFSEPWIQSFSESTPPPRPHNSAQTNTNFAFLVHNQDSISSNSAPNIDNKPLVRQRRRRTSPEDHIILEVEFQRNPKPDREARRRIVDSVSLGDKEVHIWFQNRRQKVRRKGASSPDDRLMEGSRAESSEPSSFTTQDSFTSFTRSDPLHDSLLSTPNTSFSPYIDVHSATGQAEQRMYQPAQMAAETVDHKPDSMVGEPHAGKEIPSETTVDSMDPLPISRTATLKQTRILEEVVDVTLVPWLSSDHDSIPTEPASMDTIMPGQAKLSALKSSQASRAQDDDVSGSAKNSGTARPPAATVRLSFNSSGGASLLAETETTPSPPRSYIIAPTPFATRQSLRRSYSAAGLSDFKASVRSVSSTPLLSMGSQSGRLDELTKMAPIPQRENAGRVRDSRTWEFWCDSSARNELAEHAKIASDGNARHAIGLLRSKSSAGLRHVGTGTPNLSRADSTRTQVSQHDTKRYKLSAETGGNERTISELPHAQPKVEQQRPKLKRIQGLGIFEDSSATPASPERLLHSPTGDSDKENHGPDNLRRHHTQHKGKPQRRRPALMESQTAPPFHRVRSALGSIVTNRQPSVGDGASKSERGNMDPEADEELARFMCGDKNADEKSTGSGDVDELAVQGLLSLSQGNWR